MKSRLHTLLLRLMAVLPAAHALAASDNLFASPLPPPPEIEDMTINIGPQIRREVAQAHRQIEQQLAQVRHATAQVAGSAAVAGRLRASLPNLKRSSPSLFIRTREIAPDAQSQWDEDLAVMSRILEKAASPDPARGPRVMGIDLVLGPAGGPVRSLYLEGYGILFMINVDFPLLPPPADDKENSEAKSAEPASTWEQTRQELYGQAEPAESAFPFMVWDSGLAEGKDFDASKVDQLRQNLLAALKHASNIRGLGDAEFVTICILGSPVSSNGEVRVIRRELNAYPTTDEAQQVAREERLHLLVGQETKGNAAESSVAVMTLQARKVDIDRFARGELSLEEFQSLARSHTYRGGAGWNQPGPLFWSHR